MKLSISGVCAILLMLSWTSVSAVTDIDGWNGTKWGMSEEQIKDVFKGLVVDINRQDLNNGKYYRRLKMQNFDIDAVKFDVMFEMSSSDNRLRAVRLVRKNASMLEFSKFEQLLTSKYGPQKSKDESMGVGRSLEKTASWSTPSTQIELIFNEARGFFSILNILYKSKAEIKEQLDKL